MRGRLEDNGERQMIEKRRPSPHIVTLPPSKTCTTGTRLDSLRVSIVEDNTAAGVLREGTIHNDVSWVITKGAELVWIIVGEVAKVVTKRTVVAHTTVLGVAWGTLATVGTLVVWTVNMKMPNGVAVKTNSLWSHCH